MQTWRLGEQAMWTVCSQHQSAGLHEAHSEGRSGVADLHSDSHERPASAADVGLLAAGAHVVIVCQIDIKHKLALHWRKNPVCCQACAQSMKQIRICLLLITPCSAALTLAHDSPADTLSDPWPDLARAGI